MIACASSAEFNMEETLITLKYADRATKIQNKPFVNIDPQTAEICNLRREVQDLKTQIFQRTGGIGFQGNQTDSWVENSTKFKGIKEELEKIKAENLKVVTDFQNMVHVNYINYERRLQLEKENENEKIKIDEINSTLNKISAENMNKCSNLHQTEPQININELLFTELQSKLDEFDQLREKEHSKIVNEEDSNCETSNEQTYKDYVLSQAKMQVQLTEFDTNLIIKHQLHQSMLNNIRSEQCIDMASITNMRNKIDSLEKEKKDLIESSNDDKKSADKLRKKETTLATLETEMANLKKKKEHIQKLKEEKEKTCDTLRQEIMNIKSDRVKLIKEIKTANDSFKKFKQEKEK